MIELKKIMHKIFSLFNMIFEKKKLRINSESKNIVMIQLAKEVHTLRDTACWIEYVEKEDSNKNVNVRTFELKNKIQKLR